MNKIKYTLEGDIGHYEHTISREEFIALKTFDAIEIDCSDNQLASLPASLPKCKELYCFDNQLASLPELPQCEILWCSHNRLTSLPASLPKCKKLNCYDNPLLTRYYPKSAQDLPRYHKLNNAIETLQARFLLKQVLKGCPWHPLGKKHISEAWDAYNAYNK